MPTSYAACIRHLTVAAALCMTAARPSAAQRPASGGRPPGDAALSATPLGRLAGALLATINAGDSATVARFVLAHVGGGVHGATVAARTRTFLALRAQSGGLDVVHVEAPRAGDGALRVFVAARDTARVGRRLLGIEFEPAPGDTARLADVGLHAMDPAFMRGPQVWAAGPLGDDALAAVVRTRVRQAADSDRFSGVVLVAHGGRVLVHEAVGWADRARRVPNTTATRFQTTSVGKMFTGVAIAQLVRAGQLSFDDTLARLLPDYPDPNAARRTTVRQLLTHTAGVPEPFLSPRYRAALGDVASDTASHSALLATFVDTLADAPPTAPGAPESRRAGRFAYSNGNYVALAAVVERASGLPYETYLRRYIWRPSSMRDVRHPAWDDAPGLAVPYARFSARDPLGVEPRSAAEPPVRTAHAWLRGFGGGAYTAENLFRFARALRTGRLLGPALTDSVNVGRVETEQGPPGAVRYGFGVYDVQRDGVRVVGHAGSNPDTGWDADVELVWDRDWTVVVLSNYDAPAGLALSGPIIRLIAGQALANVGSR